MRKCSAPGRFLQAITEVLVFAHPFVIGSWDFCFLADLGELIAEPAADEAGDNGGEGVDAGEGCFAGLNELQCLRAEGGEGGEAAEEADGEELAGGGSEAGIGKSEDKADDGGADDVDEKSAPGEWRADARGEQCGEPMSRDAAKAAAERDQEIRFHVRFLDGLGKIA